MTADFVVSTAQTQPEWIRLPTKGHCPFFGLSRGHYYQLINDGKIKSVSIRKPGSATGVRLVNFDSVKTFIESLEA